MKLYIYLAQKWHVKNWVDGGKIPLSKAGRYLSEERRGVNTPDEVFHRTLSNTRDDVFDRYVSIDRDSSDIVVKDMIITHNGVRYDNVAYKQYHEDVLVLCLATKLDLDLERRLVKSAVIRVHDFEKLKNSLDEQLGVKGTAGPCRYTPTKQRNHFVKSESDSWQCEYRITWSLKNNSWEWDKDDQVWVTIPKGICIEAEAHRFPPFKRIVH